MIFCGGTALVTSNVYAPQRVYFLGAAPSNPPNKVLTTQAYDFVNDVWTIGEVMSPNRIDFGAVVIDDVLYIIGGYTYSGMAGECALVGQYVPFGYRSVSVVELVSPLNQVYNESSVDLVFVVDRPVSLLYYCVDGGVNATVAGNTTLSELLGGVHSMTVFAEDKFGNVGVSDTVVFSVAFEPAFLLTVPVVVILCVVSVLAVAVLFLFLRRRRSVRSLQAD